jgi:hypothetical protein
MRGIDVLTVQEDGYRNTPEPIVLDRAIELGRVLFSQDDDLLAEATRRQRTGESFGGVIYAHQQRINIGMCVRDLELITQAAEPEDLANRVTTKPCFKKPIYDKRLGLYYAKQVNKGKLRRMTEPVRLDHHSG